jgi:toxin ParE1/3/4
LAPHWEVRLAEAAERDFRTIIAWTVEHFGSTQARRYRDVLVSALASLADGPTPLNWKARDEIVSGLRSLHVGQRGRRARHVVFFRQGVDNVVEVLRILHDAMDPARHIPP